MIVAQVLLWLIAGGVGLWLISIPIRDYREATGQGKLKTITIIDAIMIILGLLLGPITLVGGALFWWNWLWNIYGDDIMGYVLIRLDNDKDEG